VISLCNVSYLVLLFSFLLLFLFFVKFKYSLLQFLVQYYTSPLALSFAFKSFFKVIDKEAEVEMIAKSNIPFTWEKTVVQLHIPLGSIEFVNSLDSGCQSLLYAASENFQINASIRDTGGGGKQIFYGFPYCSNFSFIYFLTFVLIESLFHFHFFLFIFSLGRLVPSNSGECGCRRSVHKEFKV
jgi:hypothetical protein